MPITSYEYNKLCDSNRLAKEIGESSIITALDRITTVSEPALTTVFFKDALSTQDETTLDTLVTNHVNTPLPENVEIRVKEILPAYKIVFLERSGSRELNVRGSLASPFLFEFAPGSGETWDIERVLFGIDDAGLSNFLSFGGIGTLANGLLLKIKTQGSEFDVCNIKDNADITMIFPNGTFTLASGVLDTADGYYGCLEFQNQMRLQTNDFFRAVVRDDLSSINILRVALVLRRVL